MRQFLLVSLAGLISACTITDPLVQHEPLQLLSGHAVFGREIPPVAEVNVLAPSDAMRRWVVSRTQEYPHARTRLERLLQGLIDEGLNLEYDLELTLAAQETFTRHQGNCLSFSLLFVALARLAGLEVDFQMVEIPPSFSAHGDLIVSNNHINVQVRGVRSDVNFLQDYVVDFNRAEFDGNYPTRRVDDDYAFGLYYGNLAAQALQNENYVEAFRQLKRGLLVSPDVAGLWVNLGVLYSRNGHPEMAESAYKTALSVEPRNKSALVNLVKIAGELGKLDDARYYQQRVRRYLAVNPYYHHYRAQIALDQQRFDEALAQIARAIRLKADEHRFYYLEGLARLHTGRVELAEESFLEAMRHAQRPAVRETYARKLRALHAGS